MRAVLPVSSEASSLPPSAPTLFSAARREDALWARQACAVNARQCCIPHAHVHVHVHVCARRRRGMGGAAARTANVQRGEGHVVLERGTQLLGSVGTNFILCRVRGACSVGAAGVRGVCLAARRRLSCPCESVMVPRGEGCHCTHLRGPAW